MLDEQVGGADLALGAAADATGAGAGAVVLGHVDLELLGVGALGGLPAGLLLLGVEVVGEVLGVAVADLPVGGEAGLGLLGGQRSGALAMGLVAHAITRVRRWCDGLGVLFRRPSWYFPPQGG